MAGENNEPLLLIRDTNINSPEENPNLVLENENLATILNTVGNRPLSIFSVVGPQKSGKSLLLGYMVKCLLAAENDEAEWIDWNAKNKPLDEMKWPQRGLSPDTPGIWCFNRPFILRVDDHPEGKEIAVLLLYTQSSEKWKWTADSTASALAALTIFASSCTIFNVCKQMDEKFLSAMSTYITKAILGVEKNEAKNDQPTSPFQNAMILVRDWSFPSEYPYGASGGGEYVKLEKLREKLAQSKTSRINRQLVNAAFGKVSGCLLPYPGNDAIKPTFKGSLAEMETQFVECLKHFVEEVIDVDDPVLKRNPTGRLVHGEDWKNMLEKFIDAVNYGDHDEQVNGESLLKELGVKRTFLPGEEREYMKMALGVYNKTWNRKPGKESGKPVTEKELIDNHSKAKRRALKTFKKEMKPAESDDDDGGKREKLYKKAEKQLKEKLEEKFRELKIEKDKMKMGFIEKCKEELIGQYSESMSLVFSNKSRIPSEATIRRQSEQYINPLESRFLEKIGEHGSDARTTDHFLDFSRRLRETEAKILSNLLQTEVHQPEASSWTGESSRHPSSKFDLFDNLDTKRNGKSPGVNIPVFHDLKETNTNNLNDKRNTYFGESRTESEHSQQKSREQKRQDEEKMKNKTKELVAQLKSTYTFKLTDAMEREVDLERCRAQMDESTWKKFDEECPYQKASQDYRLLKSVLEDDLKMAFSSAKSKVKQESRSKQANLVKAMNEASSVYEAKLEEYMNEHKDATQSQLEKTNKQFMDNELDRLSQRVSPSDFQKVKAEVKEDMVRIFEKMKEKNERSRETRVQTSKRLMNECKEEYRDKMNAATRTCKNQKDLEHEHSNARTRSLDKFRSQSGIKENKQLFNEQLEELEQSLDTAFTDFKNLFVQKMKSEAGTAQLATQEARLFYKAEMEKLFKNHEFILEADLLRIHKKVSGDAIKKCPPNADQSQKKELKDFMEQTFKMYKDQNDMNMNVEPAIGIDLGTTFSCVAVYQQGEVKIIPNSVGKLTTPSYVLFHPSGEEIVGVEAKERAYENPEGTIFDAKRILGRKINDPKLQEDMKLWAFTVVDGGHGIPMIEVNGKRMNPEVISAKILTQLKKDAEAYLKRSVTKAVITVPAYFTDGQKQATVDAGKMAGLEVLSILNEPVAAAMAYKLQYSSGMLEGTDKRHILIFDLGGGTFDVAVLKTSKGNIEVLTVDGDTHLGGEDFDKNMMDYCAEEFKKVHKVDLFKGKDSTKKSERDEVRRTLKRLQAECERQKITLTNGRSAEVRLDNIYKDLDLKVTVSRATFEKINGVLFETTIQVVEKALKAAKLDKATIDDIVLVGGSTRIPKIQKMLKDFFNGKELDKKINPDEAVAHGAGLLAAIKKGNISKDSAAFTKIQDVTPMPIGVEVYGGGFSTIIPKSTKTPVKCQEKYKTAHNNQTSVQITIYEGEDRIAVKNKHLGDFYLNGIPPKDAGVEEIDVEMMINDQGILHVTASCSSSGVRNAVTVTENKQRMGQAAIRRYIAEKK